MKKSLWTMAMAVAVVALVAGAPALGQEHPPTTSAAQEAHPPAAAGADGAGHESAGATHEKAGGHEEESIWPFIGKLFNFAVLVGVVVYFGRKPIADYLTNRRAQVRADLVAAEEMKTKAAAQIVEMDAKLKALPAELDALKARGQQEVAAEEKRIRELAEVERTRLLEQASREIEQRTRLARKELVEHAASLAVEVASTKIRAQITDADQSRLVDRYLAEVKSHE